MEIYKLKDRLDAHKLLELTLSGLSNNQMDLDEPLFSDEQELFDYFDVTDLAIQELYDNDYPDTLNLLPFIWLDENIISKLVKNKKFPLYAIIGGHTGYRNYQGQEKSIIFKIVENIKEV